VDQKLLLDALSSHLDALSSQVQWFALTALATSFAGATRRESFDILGLQIERKYALLATALFVPVTELVILLSFWRVYSILSLLDSDHFLEGFTTLATHNWILNPFSFFGESVVARAHSVASYGLFFCLFALGLLPIVFHRPVTLRMMPLITIAVMLTSTTMALVIWMTLELAIARLNDAYPALHAAFVATFWEKDVSFMFILVVIYLTGAQLKRWNAR
jgi:hypothetical protein